MLIILPIPKYLKIKKNIIDSVRVNTLLRLEKSSESVKNNDRKIETKNNCTEPGLKGSTKKII